MRAENVVFDLYGTLVDIRTDEHGKGCWERTAEIFRENGAEYLPKELEKRYFEVVSELEHETNIDLKEVYPEIDILRAFRILYREKGASADGELAEKTAVGFRRASTKFIRLYPNVVWLLSGLSEDGARVILLSNAQAAFTRPELRRLGLDGLFDKIFLSSDFGIKKPDLRFFGAALKDLDPQRTVMVGNDMTCDIEPAKKLGLSTVYVRSKISPKSDNPSADMIIRSGEIMRVREWVNSEN